MAAALASLVEANQNVTEAQKVLVDVLRARVDFGNAVTPGTRTDDDQAHLQSLDKAIDDAQKNLDDLVEKVKVIQIEVEEAKRLFQEATVEKNKIAPPRAHTSGAGTTELITKIEIGFVQRFNFLATKPSQVASESKAIVISFPGNDPDRQDVTNNYEYFYSATVERFREFRISSSSVESVVLFPPFSTGMNLGSAQQKIEFDGNVNFPICELNLNHDRGTSLDIMIGEKADDGGNFAEYRLSSIARNFSSISLFSVYQDLTFVGEYRRGTKEIVTIRFFVRKDVNRRRFMLVGASVVKQIIP